MAHGSESETLVAVALMLGTALVVTYLGYRIRYRGDVRLIAGYDPDGVTDDEGLADLVGGVTIALGAAHVVFGAGLLVVQPRLPFWLAYVGVLCAGLLVVQVRGRQYTV